MGGIGILKKNIDQKRIPTPRSTSKSEGLVFLGIACFRAHECIAQWHNDSSPVRFFGDFSPTEKIQKCEFAGPVQRISRVYMMRPKPLSPRFRPEKTHRPSFAQSDRLEVVVEFLLVALRQRAGLHIAHFVDGGIGEDPGRSSDEDSPKLKRKAQKSEGRYLKHPKTPKVWELEV